MTAMTLDQLTQQVLGLSSWSTWSRQLIITQLDDGRRD